MRQLKGLILAAILVVNVGQAAPPDGAQAIMVSSPGQSAGFLYQSKDGPMVLLFVTGLCTSPGYGTVVVNIEGSLAARKIRRSEPLKAINGRDNKYGAVVFIGKFDGSYAPSGSDVHIVWFCPDATTKATMTLVYQRTPVLMTPPK